MNTPITICKLVSEEICYEMLRRLRWPERVRCPFCGLDHVIRRGHNEVHRGCQCYECKGCQRRFDDLIETVLAGHHQPLSVWLPTLLGVLWLKTLKPRKSLHYYSTTKRYQI